MYNPHLEYMCYMKDNQMWECRPSLFLSIWRTWRWLSWVETPKKPKLHHLSWGYFSEPHRWWIMVWEYLRKIFKAFKLNQTARLAAPSGAQKSVFSEESFHVYSTPSAENIRNICCLQYNILTELKSTISYKFHQLIPLIWCDGGGGASPHAARRDKKAETSGYFNCQTETLVTAGDFL